MFPLPIANKANFNVFLGVDYWARRSNNLPCSFRTYPLLINDNVSSNSNKAMPSQFSES